jgi:predicted  nucleic acid-binding Zn-ribbon protein
MTSSVQVSEEQRQGDGLAQPSVSQEALDAAVREARDANRALAVAKSVIHKRGADVTAVEAELAKTRGQLAALQHQQQQQQRAAGGGAAGPGTKAKARADALAEKIRDMSSDLARKESKIRELEEESSSLRAKLTTMRY